jgi:hypothetical protein
MKFSVPSIRVGQLIDAGNFCSLRYSARSE